MTQLKNLAIHRLGLSGDRLDVEIVERKGLGHPDTLCDGVAEKLSLLLSRYYRAECGDVLHHNVDKVLLVGGAASPVFGGGELTRPIELFLAGRATASFNGKDLPLETLAAQAVRECFAEQLPTFDVERDLGLHTLIRPGSVDLTHLFKQRAGKKLLSNDTSCGVGYAPLSRLESIVLAVENALAAASRAGRPEFGADVKIMGVRRGTSILLTVACAVVSRYARNLADYLAIKKDIADIAQKVAREHGATDVSVVVNAADDPAAEVVYLTVSGTSAEAGDDGEAGRGNRVNGLITPYRPMTMESVAGKNPVTHIGKIYNVAASVLAQRLVDDIRAVEEAECVVVGQIGAPLDQPLTIDVSVRAAEAGNSLDSEIAAIVADELARIGTITQRLIDGRLGVGRWPLERPSRV